MLSCLCSLIHSSFLNFSCCAIRKPVSDLACTTLFIVIPLSPYLMEKTRNIRLLSQGGWLYILVSLGCFASFCISISCPIVSVFIFSMLDPCCFSDFPLYPSFTFVSFYSISLLSPLMCLFDPPTPTPPYSSITELLILGSDFIPLLAIYAQEPG